MKVLFVDDESLILEGIQRSLYETEWDIHCAASGEEALQFLANNAVDVVVSDMRMPNMDGAQLLKEVCALYPHTFRIILSGQAENSATLEASLYAHQWRNKPCDTNVLIELLNEIEQTRNAFPNAEIRNAISGLKSIASPPAIFLKIQEAINSKNSNVDEVARIIASDLALSAKILHLANSAFFSRGGQVDSVDKAILRLGQDVICNVVLMLESFSSPVCTNRKFIEDIQAYSYIISQTVSKMVPKHLKSSAQLAGLLHDVGKILLMQILPDRSDELSHYYGEEDGQSNSIYVERNRFNADHAQVGAYLIQLWGFSLTVVEGILYHHNLERIQDKEFNISAAIYIADCLYHELEIDPLLIDHFAIAEEIEGWKIAVHMMKYPGEEND